MHFAKCLILGARESRSKPDRGIVSVETFAVNGWAPETTQVAFSIAVASPRPRNRASEVAILAAASPAMKRPSIQ